MLLWETLSSPTHCVRRGPSEEKNQQNACVCVCIYRVKEWAHVITEVEPPQDLKSAGWGPSKASV